MYSLLVFESTKLFRNLSKLDINYVSLVWLTLMRKTIMASQCLAVHYNRLGQEVKVKLSN